MTFIIFFILAIGLDLPQTSSQYIVESLNQDIHLELDVLPKLQFTLAPSPAKPLKIIKKNFYIIDKLIKRSFSLYHQIDLPPPVISSFVAHVP